MSIKNILKKGTKEASSTPTIEEQFKKKSLHQHILDLPDTYIGSVQNDLINIYTYVDEENKIIKKVILEELTYKYVQTSVRNTRSSKFLNYVILEIVWKSLP